MELHRADDPAKDQSYVLGVLTQDQLRHALFPLGGDTKTDVRAEAEQRGLAVADKPDSHDICFVADGDTAGFLNRRLGQRAGAVVDQSRAAPSARTRAATSSPSASAAGCGSGCPPTTASRATCWTSRR